MIRNILKNVSLKEDDFKTLLLLSNFVGFCRYIFSVSGLGYCFCIINTYFKLELFLRLCVAGYSSIVMILWLLLFFFNVFIKVLLKLNSKHDINYD